MRYAILDLGTNTFNLLIIDSGPGDSNKILLSRKEPVKLGEDGITKGKISEKAFERGIAAIENHMKYIKDHRVHQTHAFATSAIRSADNGLEFVRTVYQKFNIGIQIISGDKEAELVYHGVKQVVDMGDRKHLILDIGGGSNELIIADGHTIFWKKSFPLGMARILEQFRPSDPIKEDEILALENHFSKSMQCFLEAALEHRPDIIVGSSGSFDTFRALLMAMNYEPAYTRSDEPHANELPVNEAPADEEPADESPTNSTPVPDKPRADLSGADLSGIDPPGQEPHLPFYRINPEDFLRLCRKLVESDASERLSMEGMDPMRVEMIVIAAIFVNFIIRELNIRQVIQSDYSLKEGAVAEILNRHILSA
jgi:exopolyphosphatase / guanosine-5'-triphosphate,3'-diphosphate pyrophosphatase